MKSKSKLIYIISSILVATLMIGSILLIGFSFGWFGDKKGADVTIKVSQIKSTVTSETELEPSSLVAGNFFDKTLKVKIESEAEIYLRTYAEMVVQTKDGDKTDLIELIRVTKTRKGRDNKFYYVADSNSVATINGNAEFSLTYKFYVDSSISEDLFKDADGNYDKTKKVKITYYFEYCQKEGYDDWGSDLVDETSEKYTITFDANGGTIVGSNALQFEFGETITGLPTATKENYVFTGWQTSSGSTVKENSKYTWKNDITLYAQFKQAKYTITFVNYDGTELQTLQVEVDTMPTAPTTTPTKPSTNQYEYTFSGWTPALSLVTGNKTYTATYTEKLRTYTITFVNYDGTELLTLTEVPYGTTPVYDKETPTRPNDENYIYTFSGWNEAISPVTGDKTYTAQYSTRVAKAYLNEVEFKNLSGLKTISFEKTAPSGYTKSDSLTATYGSNGIEVYYNGGTETAPQNISLVFEGTIVATSNKYFQNCSSITSITFNNFDTSEMTDMSGMFASCSSLESLDLSNLDTSNVTNMSKMFQACTSLTGLTLGGKFNTSEVTDMNFMFAGLMAMSELDFSSVEETGVNTQKVKYMNNMFAGFGKNGSVLNLSGFSTPNVETMAGMFSSSMAETITFGSNFDTSNVTNMNSMFSWCAVKNVDISNFVVRNVKDMGKMFYMAIGIQTINVSSWATSSLVEMSEMFKNCSATVLDLSNFNTNNVTSLKNLFYSNQKLTQIDISGFVLRNNSGTFDTTGMLTDCTSLTTIIAPQEIDEGIEIALPTTSTWYVEGLTTPITKITNLEQGKTIRNYIVTMELPSDWQTKITNLDATKITKIGFENFASSDYTKVENSFNNLVKTYIKNGTELLFVCDSTIYSPEDASSLFANLTSLTDISFSNFKLKDGCTSISEMFKDCSALTQVSLASFNTKGVANMSGLFSGCSSLNNIILCDKFVSMYYDYNLSRLFENCSSLENINFKYDTLSVIDYSRMFYGCSKLNILDLGSFTISGKRDTTDMLTGCDALVQIETPYIYSQNTIILPTTKTYYLGSTGEVVTEITGSMNAQTIYDHIIQGQLSKTWKSELPNSSNITTLTFTNKIPSGYSSSPAYSWTTGVKAYRNNTTNTQVAIVFNGVLLAPEDSTGLFQNLSNLTSINFTNFKTNITINMKDMFNGCSKLTSLDLSKFDTTNVIDMSGMFNGCTTLASLNISSFNTENVTDMSKMFYNCQKIASLTFPSTFKTDKVTNMSGMFYYLANYSSIDVSNFNTSNVTDMSYMFYRVKSSKILGLNDFDTSKVTNMSGMFVEYWLDLDLTGFDTSNVINMSGMFENFDSTNLDLSTIVIRSDCDTTDIFKDFWGGSITSPQTFKTIDLGGTYYIDGYYNNQTISITMSMPAGTILYSTVQTAVFPTDWKTKVSALSSTLTASTITGIKFEKTAPSGYTTKVGTITGAGKSIDVYRSTSKSTDIAFVSSITIEPASCSNLFGSLTALTTISFNNFDTQYITSMFNMFRLSSKITTITFGDGFDTSNVTSMMQMFHTCSSLKSLDLSQLKSDKLTDIFGMFVMCSNLETITFSDNFITNKIQNMLGMFSNCTKLKNVDFSKFDTSNVTNMSTMFYNCQGFDSIDLSSFDTSKVTDMSQMFSSCKTSQITFGKDFVTTSVTNMGSMFKNATITSDILDLSSFEIKSGCDVTDMFTGLKNSSGNYIYYIITPATAVEIDLPTSYYLDGYGAPYNKIPTNMNAGSLLGTDCGTVNLPTTWKTTLGDMYTTATKIYFNYTIPSGFTYKAKLDTTDATGSHMDIYSSGTEVALINGGTIYAPTSLQNMFGNATTTASANKTIARVYFVNFNTSKTTTLNALFANCTNLTEVTFGSAFTTDKVTGYTTAFYNCSKLTQLDLSTFEVSSNCTSIGNVLSGCTNLTNIYAPKITNASRTLTLPSTSYYVNGYGKKIGSITSSTSGVTKGTLLTKTAADATFASTWKSDISSKIAYANITSMTFTKTAPTSGTLIKQLTGGVEAYYSGTAVTFYAPGTIYAQANSNQLFRDLTSLTTISFYNFNTSKVTNMYKFFAQNSKLATFNGLTNFDTSNVTNMEAMFWPCAMKTLDLSSFTIKSGCIVSDFFAGCSSLNTLITPKKIASGISIPLPSNTVAVKGSSNGTSGCQAITSSTTTSTTYYVYNIKNYIQNSTARTQYINTGYTPTSNWLKVEVKYAMLDTTAGSLFGGGSDDDKQHSITCWANMYYVGLGRQMLSQSTTTGTTYTKTIEAKNGTLTVGSSSATYSGDLCKSATMGIFRTKTPSGWSSDPSAYARIYTFKLYDNGTLRRDFIPVQSRYSSTVIGLYDKANNKLYLNAGSGSFTIA